jgi:PTH1 family peptidyl-tRNA hydrolase
MLAPSGIRLIVGLGNPGPDYASTRHNAGAWWVNALATEFNATLRVEKKWQAFGTLITTPVGDCHLLLPQTYMNNSGLSVSSCAQFYRIPAHQILIAHDELDFSPGTLRLKYDGGAGGHNGLKDIQKALGSPTFYRLRIGIGHPGHRDEVHDYVLGRPSKHDAATITEALTFATACIPEFLQGQFSKIMQILHDRPV